MPFNQKPQTFNAKINEVTIGSGEKAIKIGGENVFPLYSFDAPIENAPKVGVEITDMGFENACAGIKDYYAGCATIADMAKKASEMEGADFVALSLEGGDPNGENKSVEELVALVKEVAAAVDCPLVVEGSKNVEKDGELLVSRKITESNGKEVDSPVFTNRYTEKLILPQTGVLWWPVPILLCTGLLFCIIGAIKRRLRKNEK